MSALPIYLFLSMLGQSTPLPAPGIADARNTAEERMESMRDSMKIYGISRGADGSDPLKLQDEPAFRLGRNGNLLDGAVFLFVDDVGRPEAAIQAWLERTDPTPKGKWLHEFTSLSDGPLHARRGGNPRWQPAEPGVTFKPVPEAPKPASTPSARLRQMRAIADEFHADDDYGGGGYRVLRMLTKPIARFGKAGGTPEDGALFAFVEDLDSEVFLFVEARKGSDGGLEWQYGLAPVGCWAVKVKHKGREVWNLPRRSTGDPTKPLFNYQYWP